MANVFRECLPAVVLAAACASSVPANCETLTAVQYFHKDFEHYFVTADRAEIEALDREPMRRWFRTGTRYRVESAAGPTVQPVCRFHTTQFAGRSSHFFTAFADECAAVKGNPAWTYEGIAFHAPLAGASGACPAGFGAVNRFYNAGMTGAPNHAYVTDPRQGARLLAAGWVAEGTAYCAPLTPPDTATAKLAGTTWVFPDTPGYFGTGGITTKFVSTVAVGPPNDNNYRLAGLPALAAFVYHDANGAWGGGGGFDPWTGTYVVSGASGFEYGAVVGIAWEFADVDGASVATCTMVQYSNLLGDGFTTPPHPYQPLLSGGCQPGVAVRL